MDGAYAPSRRSELILLAILAVGTALRTVNLCEAPPGLNQDEAANAWNAYCLLRTGQDQVGARWPIFYSRYLGENRTTLYMYYLIPFQAVGGLNVWTLRFASAAGGVAALLVIYYVGKRLFGRPAGLVAAGLLAITPWAIQQSRWGHEASIVPLLMLLPVAAWLWAGLPFVEGGDRPRAWRAGLAGLLTGVCCYGYPVVRIVMPLLLLLAVALAWRAWWKWLRLPRGPAAGVAFAAGFAATFGPLAWMHVTRPEIMNKRHAETRVWRPGDPLATQIGDVLARYPGHFGYDFLFYRGDVSEFQSPPMSGLFHAYMLPLMLVGAVAGVWRWRELPAARLLAAWLLVYPVGDCLNSHIQGSLHALRSLPGLPALVLLGAWGAAQAVAWLRRWPRVMRMGIAGTVAVMAALNVQFWLSYFGEYNRRPDIRASFHADLMEATAWLRPRFEQFDAVFCTAERTNMPYILTLVGLGYEPRRWFAEPREMTSPAGWDLYQRYGKMYFVFVKEQWEELEVLKANGRRDRVAFIITPNEVSPSRVPGIRPTVVMRSSSGHALLWICEAEL